MKNKIVALVLIGFLGLYMAPTLLAKSQGEAHRAYPEFKPVTAKNVELVKKMTVHGPLGETKGKPANLPKKPSKDEGGEATGILGDDPVGNKYAIVIGVADYPGTDFDLNYTDDDAYDMELALLKNEFLSENIKMLVDENATYDAIKEAVIDLKYRGTEGDLSLLPALTPNDEVVFFFSGHGGVGNVDGSVESLDESIWVHDNFELVPIYDDELTNWFSNFPTNRIIFAFDSCRAGGMNDLAAEGRIINMATTETGTAYEFSALENGQFSYYFAEKALLEGNGDVTITDGMVTIEEAFDYTKNNYRKQDKRQGPTISDNFANDLLL